VLLHVGDSDPSGESIFTAMTEDAGAFVEADRVLATARIIAERVALTQQQVDEYDLPSTPAKASDSRSAAWEGGTCQLEALPPDVLAQPSICRPAPRGKNPKPDSFSILAESTHQPA
jgi:hypothetical protein